MQDDLDILLRQRAVPEARDDLTERILAQTSEQPSVSALRAPRWFVWYQAAFAAVCVFAVIGFLVTLQDMGANDLVLAQDSADPIEEIALYMIYDSLL